MIKIVKNRGQISALAGKSKYLFKESIIVDGQKYTSYALPGIKPIIEPMKYRIKSWWK